MNETPENTFTMDKTELNTPELDATELDTPELDDPESGIPESNVPESVTPESVTQKPDEKKTPKTLKDKLTAELEKQKQLKAQAKKAREKIRQLQKDLDRDTLYADIAKLVIIAYRLTKNGTITSLPENIRPEIPVDQNRLQKLLGAIPLKAATREKINNLIS